MKNQLLLILLQCGLMYSQPGYVAYEYNLNDLPEDYVIQNRERPDFYMLTVLIDSTTSDFSKLNLLKNHKEITFNIKTSKFPKQFNLTSFDSIKTVNFFCSDIVVDIGNLKGFNKVNSLNLHNYSGKILPSILTRFEHLQGLHLLGSKKLSDITVLKKLKNLKSFTIDCTSLVSFPKFRKNTILKFIDLQNLHQSVDLRNLGTISNLSGLEINVLTELSNIPANLPQSLYSISITGNVLSISNISHYKELQVIRVNSTLLESFNVDLSKNKNHLNIGLSNNQRMANIDGIYTCENLDYLILSGLPLLRELDITNLTLEKGLTLQSTGLRTIKPSNKLKNLNKLYIHNNDYLNIELSSNPKWDIFNNGKLK